MCVGDCCLFMLTRQDDFKFLYIKNKHMFSMEYTTVKSLCIIKCECSQKSINKITLCMDFVCDLRKDYKKSDFQFNVN